MNSVQPQQPLFPHWMRGFLLAATAYNVLWGIFIGWFPETFYQWVTETVCETPEIIRWQGRAVLLMAAAYLLGAVHPGRFWYLILLGAFTKLAGGIWFYFQVLDTQLGDKAIFHLLMNDAIWIPLLMIISLRARKYGIAKAKLG